MKKHLLFLLLCSVFASLNAQTTTWCPPGATWYFRVYQPPMVTGYIDGSVKLTVTRTVTIQNKTCEVMDGVFTGLAGANPGPNGYPMVTYDHYIHYVTCSTNRMILMGDSATQSFDTIVNFDAIIGDQWLMPYISPTACQATVSRPVLTVTDTGHVLINNLSLKKLKLSYLSPYGTFTTTAVERMLTMMGPLFSYTTPSCVTDGPSTENFVCYSDSTFPTYNPSGTICNFVPTVGIEEWGIGTSALKLYPNPNNGRFNLDLQQACRITIYSLAGQLVHSQDTDLPGTLTLHLPQLRPGMYYLSAELAQGRAYLKFVIE